MVWLRLCHAGWTVANSLVWLFRFEERQKIVKPDGDQVTLSDPQSACGSRPAGWYFARLGEMLVTGFLLGSALGYFFQSYSVMNWDGADDIRMPGIAWCIGLSVGLLNAALQWLVPGKSATRIRNALVGAGMAFLLISVALGYKDQGIALLNWKTITSIIVFCVVTCAAFIAVSVARFMPLDPAASAAVPLSFLYTIYDTDQYPSPDAGQFLVVAIIALCLTPVRMFAVRRVLRPEELCCSDKPKKAKKAKKSKTSSDTPGPLDAFTTNFKREFKKARAERGAQNQGEHFYVPVSLHETTPEGAEELAFASWTGLGPPGPVDHPSRR